MGRKKQSKSGERFYSVSLEYFLKRFCNVSKEISNTMDHNTVKELFPELKRTSYLYSLKNPKLVYTGKIMLVKDNKDHIIPYIVPDGPIENRNVTTKQSCLIDEILNTFIILTELSETGTLRIVGNDFIVDNFKELKKISNFLIGNELANMLIQTEKSNQDFLINGDGYLYSFSNNSSIFNDLNSISDLFMIRLNEDQSISVIVDGKHYCDLDIQLLYAELVFYFKELSVKRRYPNQLDINGCSYEIMNKYELIELMNHYRKSKNKKGYYLTRKELVNRTDKNKTYRKQRQKSKEGRDEWYDKY